MVIISLSFILYRFGSQRVYLTYSDKGYSAGLASSLGVGALGTGATGCCTGVSFIPFIICASAELVHKHDQAIMDGKDMEPVIRQLQAEDEALNEKMDKLVTKFVEDNMDNILGPWVFLNTCTSKYEFPMLDAWIDDIMTKATDKFKN